MLVARACHCARVLSFGAPGGLGVDEGLRPVAASEGVDALRGCGAYVEVGLGVAVPVRRLVAGGVLACERLVEAARLERGDRAGELCAPLLTYKTSRCLTKDKSHIFQNLSLAVPHR